MPPAFEDAERALGELFITGFKGTSLGDDTSAFLSQAGIGGVILFAHNYQSPEQVAQLIQEVQDCRGDLPFWISVDYEGGRVQRFKQGFTIFPPAAQVGALPSAKTIFDVYDLMAKELRAVGVNLNFFPSADINSNPQNPVIGDRSFGETADQVSHAVTAAVRGHLVNNVQVCVKHFPGHGDTREDSHFALPRVDTSLEALKDRELKPFSKAFKSRCSFVMTAHIVNPHLDPDRPATLSSKTLQGLLRQEMRYNRIIVSDDMEMQAITDHFGAEEAPVLALEAGCDLLIYRSEEACRKAYEAVRRALKDGKLSPERVLDASQRLRDHKKDVLGNLELIDPKSVSKKVGTAEHRAILEKYLLA